MSSIRLRFVRRASTVFAIATIAFLSWNSRAAAQDRPWEWGGGMMHPMGWMWGAWGIVMMVMMFAFWGLVIAAVVIGVRWLLHQTADARGGGDRAIQILRERYARGEIDRQEFDARRRDLGG
jgi:putative membrane protein